MRRSRLVGLIFAAIMAMYLVAAVTASAEPEFNPGTAQSFTGTSGSGTLGDSLSETITCTKDSTKGEITGPRTVGNVVVTFTGCSGKKGSGGTPCTVKSVGGGTGEIVTKTLKGELGLVATSEAASGVGLLLEPSASAVFVEIESAPCATGASVEGKVAGEATPIKGPSSKTGKLIFSGSAGVQKIKTITVLGKAEKPKLTAFGLVAASEETSEEITYTNAITVT
jgi:hypothetical protein